MAIKIDDPYGAAAQPPIAGEKSGYSLNDAQRLKGPL